jgi:hypothetical protein
VNEPDFRSELVSAVRAIAHGPVSGPTGLEAVCMALAGEGPIGHNSLAAAIREAGEAVERGLCAVAEALEARRST